MHVATGMSNRKCFRCFLSTDESVSKPMSFFGRSSPRAMTAKPPMTMDFVPASQPPLYVCEPSPIGRTRNGVTAATFAGPADLELVGVSGLGPAGAADLLKYQSILSHATISAHGREWLYLSVGCTSDFADNGRCDRDPAAGTVDFGARVFVESTP